jgi:hypothetical protein
MDEHKKRLLKAKVSMALYDELGRMPTKQEIERYTQAARVLYKVVLGLHFERKARKTSGQLPIF